MSRSTIRRNKWKVVAGVLLVLSVIVGLLTFGQTAVQADSTTTVTVNEGNVNLSGGFQAGNFPETWDLIKSDLTVSFTYDGYGLVDDSGGAIAHAWAELGIRDKTTTSNFNPNGKGVWLATDYEWTANTFEPEVTPTLDDKLILQRQGGQGEGAYNLPSTPPIPGNNHRVWWDRHPPVGPTANTGGKYNIVLKFHATSATAGQAYMNINGLDQGFETDGNWSTIELSPAGMTFSGDMTKMQVFYGISGYGATHNVKFENITATGVKAPSNLTVDLSGTWNRDITVELWSSDGATKLWANGNQHGAVRTYSVTPGTYDVKLVQGPKVLVIDNLDCNNDCTAGDVTADLKVDLSGTWNRDITVQLKTKDGDLIWAVGNQHGGERHYNVLKNTYDLTLVQGPKTLGVNDIVCTGETCDAGDVTETLTVDLSGSWNRDITVQLYVNDGDLIWAVGNQHGAVRTYNVLKNTYDLKLVQGPKELGVADIDCDDRDNTVSCTAGDVTADLKVDLSGSWNRDITVQLKTKDGDLIWSAGNQHNAERHYNVLKNTYDLTLVQGPKTLGVNDIGCTGETCEAGDVTETLTVDLSGTWNRDITVQLYVNDGDLIWSAGNQHGAVRTYNVLKNTYDLKLVQGPKTLDVADIDCDDRDTAVACTAGDVIADLEVDLSGSWNRDITVQLKTDSGELIWSAGNQHNAERHYNVLKNTYDLTLVEGPKMLGVNDIVCTGEDCDAGDVTETLTVDLSGTWNRDITVQLYVNGGGLIWSAGNQHGAVRTYNVLKNTYDLKLVQGSKELGVANIDCKNGPTNCKAGDVIAELTINMTGFSGVTTELHKDDDTAGTAGDLIWAVGNQSSVKTYLVLKNHYDVVLKIGSNTYSWDAVDCTGDTCVLDKATLTVNFPSVGGVHVYLRNNDGVVGTATGANVQVKYNQNHSAVFTGLTPGLYDVVLVRNAKTKVVDAVVALGGNAAVNNIVQTLTVDFTGVKGVHVYVRTNDEKVGEATGGNVEVLYNQNDTASIVVLENTYDVVLVRNAKTKVVDAVNCNDGGTCTVDNIVKTLTVNFPSINGVHVYVRTDDGIGNESATGGNVEVLYNQNGSASIPVLESTYDVVLVRNAKTKVVDAVNCNDGGTCTVDNIVQTLKVNFPGVNGVHVYVRTDDKNATTANGGNVEVLYNQNGSASIPVLENTYDVVLVRNAKTKVVDAVNCEGPDACEVKYIVQTLKVNFPGINGVHVYVRTDDGIGNESATGGNVEVLYNQNGSASIPVLENTYDVVLVRNAKTKVADAVNCTDSGTCTVDNIVATLSINFPGLNGVHVYVRTNDEKVGQATGGNVEVKYNQNGSATFALLKNYYDVVLVKNGSTGIADAVNCTGATCTLAGSNLQINAPAGTTVQVKHYTSGAVIASGTVAGNQWVTFSNLAIGIYDIVLTQGANTVTLQDRFHIAGATIDMLNVLQVNAPAVTKVDVLKSGGLVAGGTVAGNQWVTLYLLKDTYDLRLTQGAKVKDVTGVNCAGDNTSLDQLSVLNVNAPAGTKVKVYVPGTTKEATSGTVAGNQWVTLYVVSDTYDVYLEQNAAKKTLKNVNVNNDTSTDELCLLKVNAPANTAVEVLTGDGLVTGGTVAGDQWVTLYVVKGTYDLKLTQGAEVKTVEGFGCTSETASTDQLAELKVNAPANTFVQVLKSGSLVANGTVAGNQWVTLYVVKDTYNLKLTQNAEVKDVPGVNCKEVEIQTEDHLSVLKVNAPAGTEVKVYVPNTKNEVTSGTVAGNQWVTLYVVGDIYDVFLKQNAAEKTLKENIASDKDLYELCTLKVNAAAGTAISVFTGTTGLVTSGTVAGNQWVTLYVVLGTYDVFNGTTTKSADCNGASATVTFL